MHTFPYFRGFLSLTHRSPVGMISTTYTIDSLQCNRSPELALVIVWIRVSRTQFDQYSSFACGVLQERAVFVTECVPARHADECRVNSASLMLGQVPDLSSCRHHRGRACPPIYDWCACLFRVQTLCKGYCNSEGSRHKSKDLRG